MRIGVRLPTAGPAASRDGILGAARGLEAAGAEALWVSDHVVQPRAIASPYPYAADGRATWDPAVPQLEAVTALAAVAAVTTHAVLGTAVLVLPQRQPVLLAQQLAAVDVIAGGRLVIGVGAGWLAEEFAALGADFARRGALLDEGIAVLRSSWAGEPVATPSHPIPAGIVAAPVPAAPIRILVGGMSGVAMRRAARLGDGWIAQVAADAEGVAAISEGRRRLHDAALAAGRDPGELRIAARVSGPGAAPGLVRDLAAAGVGDAILDAPADPADLARWRDAGT